MGASPAAAPAPLVPVGAGAPTEAGADGAVRQEALRRLFLAARHDLPLYARLVFGLAPARHHRAWLTRIQEALAPEAPPDRRRVVIVAPPGSAKTSAISQWVPAYYLGAHPDRSLLVVTASDAMARQHSLVMGGVLAESAAHRRVFPEPGARPAGRKGWSVDGLYLAGTPGKDPAYRAVGLGAHILGARAHVLVLDDAVTQEQAQSAVEMDRARRFVDQTLLSRLHPPGAGGGVVLAVGTRWHEQDLIAHLEASGFEVLLWPQLSPDYPGDDRDAEGRAPLWPERFPLAWVEAERARLGTAQFQLLHQGDPVAIGGQLFRSGAWFFPLPPRFAETTAPACTRVTGIDLAFSSKETADYTAGVTFSVRNDDPQRRLYLTGLFRRRLDEGELVDGLAAWLVTQQPHAVGVEIGAFRGDATGVLVQHLRTALFGKLRHAPNVHGIRAVADKVTRAGGLAVHAEAGLLACDKALELYPVWERELLSAPLGAHDDFLDASSLACNMALGQIATTLSQKPGRLRFGD